jgi:hypothetical protein
MDIGSMGFIFFGTCIISIGVWFLQNWARLMAINVNAFVWAGKVFYDVVVLNIFWHGETILERSTDVVLVSFACLGPVWILIKYKYIFKKYSAVEKNGK